MDTDIQKTSHFLETRPVSITRPVPITRPVSITTFSDEEPCYKNLQKNYLSALSIKLVENQLNNLFLFCDNQ